MTPQERAALNRHFSEMCRILRTSLHGAWQLRLNVNEDTVQSWEEKNHRRVQTESTVDTGRVGA